MTRFMLDRRSSRGSGDLQGLQYAKSLARRRFRPNHEKVRSTTHRRGKTTKPLMSSDRLTIPAQDRHLGHGGFNLPGAVAVIGAFRIAGRMIERPVNIGAGVEAGQVLAKPDPENELNELRSAQSTLAAAQGPLTYARGDFERQRQRLANGYTPRARFDQSQNGLQSAQSQVDDTEARLRIARDRVGWTTLEADAPAPFLARFGFGRW